MSDATRDSGIWTQRWHRGARIAAWVGLSLMLTGTGSCVAYQASPDLEIPFDSRADALSSLVGYGGFGMLWLGLAALIIAGALGTVTKHNAYATAGGIILLIVSIAPAGVGLLFLVGGIINAIFYS